MPNRVVFAASVAALSALAAPGETLADQPPAVEPFARLAPVGAMEHAMFGTVARVGRVLAVGAFRDGNGSERTGAVYLFDLVTGVQTARIVPEGLGHQAKFGGSMASNGRVIAASADGGDTLGPDAGAVFLIDPASGSVDSVLSPVDAADQQYFGSSIAMEGDRLVVGAAYHNGTHEEVGAVYVFDTVSGEQRSMIVPDQGTRFENFGYAVAIGNGIIAAGSWGDAAGVSLAGSVRLFDADDSAELRTLTAEPPVRFEHFGAEIHIDGPFLVASSEGYERDKYILDLRTDGGPVMLALPPADPGLVWEFRNGIAVSGRYAMVPAVLIDDALNRLEESVFVYDLHTMRPVVRLTDPDGLSVGGSRHRMLLRGGLAVASIHNNSGNGTGLVAMYDLTDTLCQADFTPPYGTPDFFDLAAFLDAIRAGDDRADLAVPFGVLDAHDVMAFVGSLLSGCD